MSEKAEGAGPRTRERDRPARAELGALRAVLRAGRDRARAAALRAVTRELRAAAWRPVRPALRAARAAFRFQTRGASPADLEFYEALLLYSWAMKIATGRSNGGFELLVYLSFLQIVRRTDSFDREIGEVVLGLFDVTGLRLDGPRTRRRRQRLSSPEPMIRLFGRNGYDAHWVSAWFAERQRKWLITRLGLRRLPPGKLDVIIEHVVDVAREKFGAQLLADRIRTILNEPKNRRNTKVLYQDR